MSNVEKSSEKEEPVNVKKMKMYEMDPQDPPKNMESGKIKKAKRSKEFRDNEKKKLQDLESELREAKKSLSELKDVMATKNNRIEELEKEVMFWRSCPCVEIPIQQELESVVGNTGAIISYFLNPCTP